MRGASQQVSQCRATVCSLLLMYVGGIDLVVGTVHPPSLFHLRTNGALRSSPRPLKKKKQLKKAYLCGKAVLLLYARLLVRHMLSCQSPTLVSMSVQVHHKLDSTRALN